MTLADYMTAKGITDADFAVLIGVNRSTVSRLRRLNQRPSFETLAAITSATRGKVTANDFWRDRTPQQAA